MRKYYFIFFLVLAVWGLKAQETQLISKTTVKSEIQANNNQVKASGYEAMVAQAAYQ